MGNSTHFGSEKPLPGRAYRDGSPMADGLDDLRDDVDAGFVSIEAALGSLDLSTPPAASTQTYADADGTHAARTSAALTENSGAIGGTNDGDLPDMSQTSSTLTDNSGGSADATLAAVTAAATITDNSGGVDPGDDIIAAITTGGNVGADIPAAVAQLAAKQNTTSAAVTAAMNNFADLAAQVNALVSEMTTAIAAVRENAAMLNALRADHIDTAEFLNDTVDKLQALNILT
jgi:hypothetical protein